MAGVALVSYGGATLRELGIALVSRARANAIAREEADRALAEIAEITPVDTSLMQRSWLVRRAVIDEMIAENTAPYAEWVHYAGERGTLFWEQYALPIWQAAQERATERVVAEEGEAEAVEYRDEIQAVVDDRLSQVVAERVEAVRRRPAPGQPAVVVELFAEWARRPSASVPEAIVSAAARLAARRVVGRMAL